MFLGIDRHPGSHLALIETSSRRALNYAQLTEAVDASIQVLKRGPRSLVILPAQNTAESLIAYLACLDCGHPVLLAEPQQVEALSKVYPPPTPAHPSLALLLQTSGSTGSPKLVRLTRPNLESNARSIAAYLELSPAEKAVMSLPFSYSFGLSIVNSHLYSGASLVLTHHSFMRPEFWADVDAHGCTSFSGVPFMYETLERIRFKPERHPSVQTYTQAGGALQVDIAARFGAATRAGGRQFYVMYGQTEASPRISYVPPDRLADKPGSIGIAIPGGKLELAPDQELIYSGPNVMLGYAEQPSDLLLGDTLKGRLATGDLGRMDEEGFFYITGRLKRFAKLFGLRINLDDVETWLETRYPISCAALEVEGRLEIFAQALKPVESEKIRFALGAYLALTPQALGYKEIEKLPLTASGKKDRQALL